MRSATTKTVMAMIALSILAGEAMSQTYIARFNLSGLPVIVESGSNRAPVSNAGPDQSVASAATVILNGSASSDPDPGDTLTYAWSQTSGAGVTLSDLSAINPSFVAPSLSPGDPDSLLVFSLIVTDNNGATSSPDTVTVTVSAPATPAPCETPGQTCDDGTSIFAGGTYMYADGKFGALRWDQANAYCTGIGSGWRLLNSPTERDLLAIPGDPLAVDGMITLWGEATITGVSGSFVPGVGVVNTCTWGARRYQLRSQNQDGNFVLHTPWGISQNYFTLGSVQTMDQCNTTTPPVNAQTYNFVCVNVSATPLP
jgi:hypothetical protein